MTADPRVLTERPVQLKGGWLAEDTHTRRSMFAAIACGARLFLL